MMKKLGKAIAARLKELREAAGLSQQELAVQADLSLSLVAKLEQGKKADPRASTVLALAGALKTSAGRILDDLFPPRPAKQAAAEPVSQVDASVEAPAEKPKKKGKKDKKKKGRKPDLPAGEPAAEEG